MKVQFDETITGITSGPNDKVASDILTGVGELGSFFGASSIRNRIFKVLNKHNINWKKNKTKLNQLVNDILTKYKDAVKQKNIDIADIDRNIEQWYNNNSNSLVAAQVTNAGQVLSNLKKARNEKEQQLSNIQNNYGTIDQIKNLQSDNSLGKITATDAYDQAKTLANIYENNVKGDI